MDTDAMPTHALEAGGRQTLGIQQLSTKAQVEALSTVWGSSRVVSTYYKCRGCMEMLIVPSI